VFSACCVASWAVSKDVLYCLGDLAALACDLVGCVLGPELLCVGTSEGVPCDDLVQCRRCASRKGTAPFKLGARNTLSRYHNKPFVDKRRCR